MENVLFKISFPAEFHAQTAVEAAMTLHKQLAVRGITASDIARITIRTHEACIRIIDKQGPLNNPADRDHCIQYMVALPLIFGRLTAEDYEDACVKANDHAHRCATARRLCVPKMRITPRITTIRESASIANALTGTADGRDVHSRRIAVQYPIGHRLRRAEGMPLLMNKFRLNMARRLSAGAQEKIVAAIEKQEELEAMPVNEFVTMFVV